MNKTLRLALLPRLGLALPLSAPAGQPTPQADQPEDEPYGPQKVVYHFGSANPQTNAGGLKNIQNHLNALPQGQLTAVALVNAGGWEMVVKQKADPAQVEKMNALITQGVVFAICRNTLREHNIDPADLAIPMKIVPAGVAELTRLQSRGYAYIKPEPDRGPRARERLTEPDRA